MNSCHISMLQRVPKAARLELSAGWTTNHRLSLPLSEGTKPCDGLGKALPIAKVVQDLLSRSCPSRFVSDETSHVGFCTPTGLAGELQSQEPPSAPSADTAGRHIRHASHAEVDTAEE